MRIDDLFKMGLKSLSRRKARTILTVLGVIIGSLSIIIMVSIGKGMENNFDSQLMQQGGLTTITVDANAGYVDENGNWNNSKQVIDDSIVDLFKTLDHVKAVTPLIYKQAILTSGKYQAWISIQVMDYEAMKEFDFPALQYGEYPNEEDNSPIVFGSSMPNNFTDPKSMMWQPVDVDIQKEKVVLSFQDYQPDPKKKSFKMPLTSIAKMVETQGEYDWSIYMDTEYFKEIYLKYCNTLSLADRKKAIKSLYEYQTIKLNVDNVDNVSDVQAKIKEMGYQSYSQMQYLEPLKKTSETLQMVLGALGAVAMVVSAISIANTMVMSIYERTKEIGIMKVLGCTIKDIRKLFLFEAGMIGLFGGLIGIILGYISSWGINKYGGPIFGALMSGNYMYDSTNTSFSIIPLYLPFMSLAISIIVGLVSGYFPARRATKISAIEAMRSEG
jgi:ABC-type antimicrobial peptide transport system permease subunit